MKLVTITITALFPDNVTDEEIHSVAGDAFVQVQEPYGPDMDRISPPTDVTSDVTIVPQ